ADSNSPPPPTASARGDRREPHEGRRRPPPAPVMRERGDDGAGRSEHRLVVIRRAARDDREVLPVQTGDGWSLPSIELPEQRSADVTDLNRAARAALGLETSVLRCLADEPGEAGGPRRHLHAIEAHADVGPVPARGRWMRPEAA